MSINLPTRSRRRIPAYTLSLTLAAGLTAAYSVAPRAEAPSGFRPAVTMASPANAPTGARAADPQTAVDVAQSVFDRMTAAQRIGQLFMVGGSVTGPGSSTASAITTYHVGNLILTGRTTSGAPPVRAIAARADAQTTSAATASVPLFIAADQEGGYVQVLQGTGFSRMPTALTQGTWSDATLKSTAKTWGQQVLWAGVDVNLAPVMDTVTVDYPPDNPIGRYQREFGHTSSVVAAKGTAFLTGMTAAGTAVTAKHFPGLGRVAHNTDTTAGVQDTVTTETSGDIVPFRAAVDAGARLVMISSAIYTKIDANQPAVFSSTVITSMLRHDLGFTGIVISDDLGRAEQVQAWSAGSRVVQFINAGGDVVLTVDPTLIPSMVTAVTARAASDSAFLAKVNAAALRVLTVKAEYGLLAPRLAVDGGLGPLTISALQRWLGLTQDGHLSTMTIKALQARIGTTADGVWGPASMKALQIYLGTSTDGARTWNRRTVAALQQYLNTQL